MDNAQEAKEILEEMQAEGHDVSAVLPQKTAEKDPVEESALQTEEDESSDDQSADDSGEDKKTSRQPERERPVPTWSMVKKQEKEISDLKTQLTDLQARLESKDTPASQKAAERVGEALDDLDAVIKGFDNPEAVKSFSDALLARVKKEVTPEGLSPEDKKLLAEERQARNDRREQEQHQAEMHRASTLLPELTDNKEAQERLAKLAYTEQYQKTPLVEVFLENKEKILGTKGDKGTRSGESSRGGSQRANPVKDIEQAFKEGRFEELSEEEFDAMSDKFASGMKYRKFTPAKKDTLKVSRRS